jgi:hypothetical protein
MIDAIIQEIKNFLLLINPSYINAVANLQNDFIIVNKCILGTFTYVKKKSTFLIIVLFALVYACRKEFGGPRWDTNILAPILHTNFGINNLIADSLLDINNDQSVTLVFDNTVFNLTADTIVKIPDTTLSYVYTTPITLNYNPGDYVINSVSQSTFNFNGPELRRATIRSGYINVFIKNEIREKVIVIYQLPDAEKNSVPFSKTFIVPAKVGNTPGTFTDTFNLNGYEIDMRGQMGSSFNTLRTNYSAQIDPASTQSNIQVLPGDSVALYNSFIDVIPQYAQGYFGTGTYSYSDTSAFDVFANIVGGSLLLDSVRMNLQIDNSVGADAKVKINGLTSINTYNNSSVSLTNPVIGSSINITRAFDANGTVVPTIYSFFLDNGNSNIKNLVENLPNKIGYSIDAEINPLGNVSGGHDFIYYGGGIKVNLNAEVPLYLAAGNLTFADTIAYDISVDDQDVDNATLTVYAENGFPFEARIRLFILNDNNLIVDSLMPLINTIDNAPVNSSYIVTQPKLTKLVIPINAQKMQNLYNYKKIYIRISFNTVDYPQLIKIYEYYKIDVKLVGDFFYNVNH